MTIALVVTVLFGIFYLGGLDKIVSGLQANEIQHETWEVYKKKVNDTYNKAFFDKDTRFTTRGGEKGGSQ